jgi:hypothetical protein
VKSSKETVAARLLRELGGCKYLYKEIVYGGIKAMRDNAGLECDATDDEIYETFKTAWNYINN